MLLVSQNVPMPRAWLLLFVAVSLCGCGEKYARVGGQFPKNFYGSEISISPSTTEIMATQGASQRLKGRDSASNFPSNIANLPIFATVTPDFEKLKQANPDLVVLDGDLTLRLLSPSSSRCCPKTRSLSFTIRPSTTSKSR